MPPIPVMANTIELGDAIPNTSSPPPPPQYAPQITLVQSGSQAARNEWIVVTISNAYGESLPSPEVKQYVPANFVVSVYPVSLHYGDYSIEISSWNCYISTSGPGTETKQNTTALQVPNIIGGINSGVLLGGNVFQEPATGLIAGTALPTTPTNAPGLISGIANLADTPPATGSLTNSGAPAGTVNTNTGRTVAATQTFISPIVSNMKTQQGSIFISAAQPYSPPVGAYLKTS